MSIPGFAAEASLYKPSQQYRAVEPFVRHANGVRTQLIIPVKPPGAQNVPGVDIACDPDCLATCCPSNQFLPCSDAAPYCTSRCCRLEYFPPRY